MKNELTTSNLNDYVRACEVGHLAESAGPVGNPAAVMQRLMRLECETVVRTADGKFRRLASLYHEHPAPEVPDASV
ncbi:hypothetical protein C7425_104249 [Pantoea ananatis]|uniref:hypothetical protein n=1 Tax=Pantoea ananas TaxID=553 RepID=UPI000D6AE7D6|nr:hypothetical protein [Pantoea ananatis]PWK09875.1 hypothetical protein C7421_103190 [Pantoea ananatis]PWV66523.1 hypothetical protein C7425_104249 [Pantoea ananatis]